MSQRESPNHLITEEEIGRVIKELLASPEDSRVDNTFSQGSDHQKTSLSEASGFSFLMCCLSPPVHVGSDCVFLHTESPTWFVGGTHRWQVATVRMVCRAAYCKCGCAGDGQFCMDLRLWSLWGLELSEVGRIGRWVAGLTIQYFMSK